jgi:tRNA-splicing ligase RtcB
MLATLEAARSRAIGVVPDLLGKSSLWDNTGSSALLTRDEDCRRFSAGGGLPGVRAHDLELVHCHHNYIASEDHFGTPGLLTRNGAVNAEAGVMSRNVARKTISMAQHLECGTSASVRPTPHRGARSRGWPRLPTARLSEVDRRGLEPRTSAMRRRRSPILS